MKRFLILSFGFLILSCSKNTEEADYPDANYAKVKYDTMAIDSFAPGATPNNMKPKVLIIEDTLATKKKEIEDKIKALEKQKEADKEKDKKKLEEKSKEKEKPKPTSTTTEQPVSTTVNL